MKKSEVFERVQAICAAHNLPQDVVAQLNELLEPKNAGRSFNWDDIVLKDENGNVVEIQCSLSGVWLPADSIHFYASRDGKGVMGTDGVILQKVSKQGENARKAYQKAYNASKNALMDDVLNGVISNEDAKAKLEELNAQGPDYSVVHPLTGETSTEVSEEAEAPKKGKKGKKSAEEPSAY
jgi:hypothetical protein|nr:MAG TPA: hypothetical protein [Caudoviricetes sp.]